MGLYELIQPSDPITFYASDEAVARAVCLMLGDGKYGLHDEHGENLDTILLFCGEAQAEKRLHDWFGDDVAGFMEAKQKDIAEALESVMVVGVKERAMFELALRAIDDPAKRETFKADLKERNRSSLNDITSRAWELAARLRK